METWVQGLRGGAVETDLPWERVLYERLVGRHDRIQNSSKTLAAEIGLNIGHCAYFYIGRCDPDFGDHVVGYRRPISSTVRVAPFDTGGLWYGYINTQPALVPSEKQKLVDENSHKLGDFERAFQAWGSVAYASSAPFPDSAPYTEGRKPLVHSATEIDLTSAAATPRWWTWEGRVASTSSETKSLESFRLYMTDRDKEEYVRWLRNNGDISVADKLNHRRFLEQIFVSCGTYDAAKAMNRWLAEEQAQW